MVKYASIRSVFCMSREPYETNTGNGDGEGNFSFQSNRVDKQQSVRDWDPSPSISLVYMHIQKSTKPIHITYHISHITVLNLNLDLETSPITPHHIKAARTERRRIKMEIFNVERVRPTYLHTPYIPTYLPTFLLHLFTFRLPSFHFISHSHVPFYVLCFMFHVSCCMSFLFHFLFYIDR